MTDKEVNFNHDHQDWEPCSTCQDVINSVFEDPLDEDEITHAIEGEWALIFQHDVENPHEDNDLKDFP